LTVVAQARNGREAVELFEAFQPQVCFLDVHMPVLSGLEAAQHIGSRAHVVFVTAFDNYAVDAFAQGAVDYLVKPVDLDRLGATAARLQQRILREQPAVNTTLVLEELAARFSATHGRRPLRWLRVQTGTTVRMIPVSAVDYFRADSKYTIVAWHDEVGQIGAAVIRTALRELVEQLDANDFVQVHRSVVVNLHAIAHIRRRDNETAEIHLKHRSELLPVSRNYLHAFRQM
jgi:DNA-binding LytR/AlgR family response regulator